MRLLLDTQLLIWTVGFSSELAPAARGLIGDRNNTLYFSSASIWEIGIKAAKGLENFQIDAEVFSNKLLENFYIEVPITSQHAIVAGRLPVIHKDPFDRILIAQAEVERMTMLTSGAQIAQYPGSILRV